MSYTVIRKDLTEGTKKCFFCPNNLTSLKAYVLEDCDSGEHVFAGPWCAEKNVGKAALLAVPDLTKFTKSNKKKKSGELEADTPTRESPERKAPEAVDHDERRALEYLALREDKLASELKCSYEVLTNYYDKSKKRSLTDKDIKHINNIEAKAPEKLSLSVLQRLYNYLFWIDVGIDKLPDDKREFLGIMRKRLLKAGKLTDGQKEATNKWLENIDGVPQLK